MFEKPDQRERNGVIRGFVRREDGNMIMLGLMFFTLMVMMGGLAVDLMRFEERRTQLQQTTDRAVLAAASMRQTLDPTSVVNDYFLKAGLSEKLKSVQVVQSYNAKSVAVTAATDIQPFFMQMMGIEEMTAPAAGTAIEKISDVEISMVLDVSGSMSTNNKIGNLRTAAKEFVDTIFQTSEKDRTTISIVPYNMQVNLGDKLSSVFNMPRNHTRSYCADLPTSTYSSTTVSQTTALTQTGQFDWASSASTKAPVSDTGSSTYDNYPCSAPVAITVTPVSDDTSYLKNRIDALTAGGNTSIDVGMKWGVTLLDPASKGIVTSLIANNTVSSRFAGRPLDPADKDVLKVVILMTDGANTDQYAVNPAFLSGLSNVYRQTSTGNLAVFVDRSSTTSDYYMPDNSSSTRWQTRPFNSATGWTQLTWPQVWTYSTLNYFAKSLYADPRGITQSAALSAIATISNKTTKDSRLSTICTAAKAKGIIVFGIGFADSATTPVAGKPQILACSTSSAYYYDVSGLQISTAFRSIANQISTLRLTQ